MAEPSATTPSEPAAASGGESASDLFKSLLAGSDSLQYKVDYTTTTDSEGETMTTSTTMVVKGKKFRTDTQVEGYKTSTYLLEDGVFICTYEGGASCLSFPDSMSQEESVTDMAASSPDDYSILARPSRTVAGTMASCFGLAGAGVEGDVEVCYSADGVMLYTHVKSTGGEYSMVATSYQHGSIADSEFTLPAQPQVFDIEGMMAAYGVEQ